MPALYSLIQPTSAINYIYIRYIYTLCIYYTYTVYRKYVHASPQSPEATLESGSIYLCPALALILALVLALVLALCSFIFLVPSLGEVNSGTSVGLSTGQQSFHGSNRYVEYYVRKKKGRH